MPVAARPLTRAADGTLDSVQTEIWTNLPAVNNGHVRRLRRAEYECLVDAGVFEREHLELVRGVIVRMSPQGAPHSGSIEVLTPILVRALGDRARVRVQLPLIGPDDSVPEPDVAVVPVRIRATAALSRPAAAEHTGSSRECCVSPRARARDPRRGRLRPRATRLGHLLLRGRRDRPRAGRDPSVRAPAPSPRRPDAAPR